MSTKLRAVMIVGTRPEAIKMAPVFHECQRRSDEVDAIICLTGQHREMLQQVTDYFGIDARVDLRLMQPEHTLAELTARCLRGIDGLLVRFSPHCVVVQGDTTTTMAASLAAFYRRVPLVHVEAGLRTGHLDMPWPEELNRRVTGMTAALHCAPTQRAADNLLAEGCAKESVHVTGNTIVDALLWTLERERARSERWEKKYVAFGDRPVVLITGHRRENFGRGLQNICSAIADLARRFGDVQFVYPVHLNPRVQRPVNEMLGGYANVYLSAPVSYPEFVWLADRSKLIVTDSGGIQEEAPTLRKPVLVTRQLTERPEAVEAGAAELVGTAPERIIERVAALLTDDAEYARRQVDANPYGDGRSAPRIVELMLSRGWQS